MCKCLTQINIPPTVTSIGNNAFRSCSGLNQITIPSSVKSIGDFAFNDCFELKEISIPSSVKSIGTHCFNGCINLEKIIFPSSCTCIEKYLFKYCNSLKQIIIPSSVTSIECFAFEECTSLIQIEIPSSVTYIGESVFRNCHSLEQVIISSSITSIPDYFFECCSSLEQITIPSSVTSIGNFAFVGCSSLEQITIPSSVTSIGNFAFVGCSSLTQISVQSSLNYVGNNSFVECPKLGKHQLFFAIYNEKHQPFILFENEYYPTNLEEYVKNKKLTKVQKVFLIFQIIEGMKYIQSRNIVHRDLVPSNIFITDNEIIKISGFEKCYWMSPYRNSQEIKIKLMEDVYSFGGVVYFILSDGEDSKNRNDNTLKSLPLLAKQLVDACWCSQPEGRPTFEIICDVLEKNNFNLLSLSSQEINEILQKITDYKTYFKI